MRHGRVLVLLVAVLVLGMVGVAIARVSAQRSGNTLTITGTDGPDEVTLEVVPGVANPNVPFFAISDPAGVTNVPPGCFRFDANTIHCPVSLIKQFVFDLGGGDDELFVQADLVDPIMAHGGPGDDMLQGGARGDGLFGEGGNDDLIGRAGNDVERGGGGSDRLFGAKGNDNLGGGPGPDVLNGGPGRDQLDGGGSKDRCNGGPGRDTDRRCEIGFNY
jgi:Ca2+-binding RTX toxin-like protein